MALIGRRFVQVSETKNQTEAEYRYVLTRLRENGESIALIRGEEEERAGVARSLRRVMAAWAALAVQNVKTTLVSQTSSYIAPVLPIILCAPKFLDGSMTLGEVMQPHRHLPSCRPPSTGWSTTIPRWPTGPPRRGAWHR